MVRKEWKQFIFLLLLFTPNILNVKSDCSNIQKPNIILITANEFGLKDFAFYRKELRHISKLSEDSANFTHVYSHLYPTSSRAALLTGRLPVRTGILKGRFLPFTSFPSLASSGGLSQSETTLAEVLDIQYYSSTKLIGLWDLGYGKDAKYLPLYQGFESWFGILAQPSASCGINTTSIEFTKDIYNEVATLLCSILTLLFGIVSLWYFRYSKLKYLLYFIVMAFIIYATNNSTYGVRFIKLRSCVLFSDETILAQPFNARTLTLRFTEEAVAFIKQPASMSNPKPFFLTINYNGLSKPMFYSPHFHQNDTVLAALHELDWSVGRIVETIDNLNMTDNTILIFTALSGVNHGEISIQRERSNVKDECDPWERNIIVPLFIKWGKKWNNSLTVNQTVSLMDIMPTILDLTCRSYKTIKKINGQSVVPLFNNSTNASMNVSLHEYFFHYHDVTGPSAVTYDKYKIFFSTNFGGSQVNHDPPLLYDLSTDPDEMSPLPAQEYTELISMVSDAVEKHLENRTRKWISQFEHPILPWLFPCADFPYCYKTDFYKPDINLDWDIYIGKSGW